MYVINFIWCAVVRTTTEIVIGNDLIIDSLFNTATINSTIQYHNNRATLQCDISLSALFLFHRVGSIEIVSSAGVIFINRLTIKSCLPHDRSNYYNLIVYQEALMSRRKWICFVRSVSRGVAKCLSRNTIIGEGISYLNRSFHKNAIVRMTITIMLDNLIVFWQILYFCYIGNDKSVNYVNKIF